MSTWPGYLASFIPSNPWRTDARADAAPAQITQSGASLLNPLSGMGGASDKGAASRPNVYRRYLNEEELIAMLRGTVYRRLVELLPQAATSKGYTLTEEGGEQNPMAKELRDLDVMGTFRKADAWGRCLGDSLVMMVVDDPAPLHMPLDPSKVTKIHRLQIYDRNEFTPVTYITNDTEGELGSPKLYSITPRRAGVSGAWQTVHASRFLRFYGDDLPPSRIGFRRSGRHRWGADAIGQTLWSAIRGQASTAEAGAQLAQELSVSVFTFGSVTGQGGGSKGEAFRKRGRDVNMMKSLYRSIWLGAKDKYERVAANPSGFRDLSEEARVYLQLLTGHPGELLFGVAPQGLNTDGKSWQVAWGAKVAAHQQDRYQRNLERLIEVVYYATNGALPKAWAVSFNPLDQLTEQELADLRVKHTMADVDAIRETILTPEEARKRYEGPTGFELELQVEEIEAEEVVEAAPPRIGEINAAIELGRSLARGELTPEQVRTIAETQLKLPPEVAAALSVPPAALVDPANLDDKETRNRARGPGTKHGAREELNKAIRSGAVKKPDACSKCSTKGGQLEGHHSDYSKPREVTWLCSQCHSDLHARGDLGEPGKAVVSIPLSQQARAKWRELQGEASNIVGVPLEVSRPHMTMLFAGAIDGEAALELGDVVGDVARRHPHSRARVREVDTFVSPEGTTAVVLMLDAYDAERLESELSRAACHLVTAKQAGRGFVAHITLGVVPRLLTSQETASLRDIPITGDPPKRPVAAREFEPQVPVGTSHWFVSLSSLEVRRNGVTTAYALTGERNDATNQGVPAK